MFYCKSNKFRRDRKTAQGSKPGVVGVSVAVVVVVVSVFAVAVVVVVLGATPARNNKQIRFSWHCSPSDHVLGEV